MHWDSRWITRVLGVMWHVSADEFGQRDPERITLAMALDRLSANDVEVVRECLLVAVRGPFFPDWGIPNLDGSNASRASPRAERPRLRLDLHEGQAHHLRLPRLPLVDPPPDVPPDQSEPALRGYKEEGTITTPFDLRVQSGLDRFHLVQHVIDRPLTWCEGELPEADHAGQAHRAQAVRRHLRLGHAGDPGLEVGRRTVSETEKR